MAKIETKEFTVQEVIDAIEQNGLEHLRGEWISTFDGKLTGGCVLGQGAVNLGVLAYDPSSITNDSLFAALQKFSVLDKKWIINDETIKELGEEGWDVDGWDAEYNCGGTITSWNDLTHEYNMQNPKYDADMYDPDKSDTWEYIDKADYFLPTYGDVVNMVKEVLAPYVNEKITIPVRNYAVEFEIVRS